MSTGTRTEDRATDTVATEFVTEEFDTEVTADDVERFASANEEVVRTLRSRITSDDRLEVLLRSGPGPEVLRENDSVERCF